MGKFSPLSAIAGATVAIVVVSGAFLLASDSSNQASANSISTVSGTISPDRTAALLASIPGPREVSMLTDMRFWGSDENVTRTDNPCDISGAALPTNAVNETSARARTDAYLIGDSGKYTVAVSIAAFPSIDMARDVTSAKMQNFERNCREGTVLSAVYARQRVKQTMNSENNLTRVSDVLPRDIKDNTVEGTCVSHTNRVQEVLISASVCTPDKDTSERVSSTLMGVLTGNVYTAIAQTTT